jgi:hypothetical protein
MARVSDAHLQARRHSILVGAKQHIYQKGKGSAPKGRLI